MNPFVYVLSVNGLLFLISIIFYFFPPKKINSIYGYRTYRTMKNEDIWNFSNRLFNKAFLRYSAISFLAGLVFVYLNPELMSSWVPMALLLFTVLVCILGTEKELNEHFNKEGNRKTKK